MAYDVFFLNGATITAGNYPRVLNATTMQPDTINLFPRLAPRSATLPPFDPLFSFTNVVSDAQNPTTHFWSLSLQRQFQRNYVLEVGYSGNRSYHQVRSGQRNPAVLTPAQAATVVAGSAIPGLQSRRLNPAWGSRFVFETSANAAYHAGYIKFDRKMGAGLLLGANYTFSANFSDADEAGSVNEIVNSSPNLPQDFFNYRNEWSRSVFDRPHRFAVYYIYEVPWFRGGAAEVPILRHVFQGWQVSGFTEFESGQPFTIRTGVDSAGVGAFISARPNVNPGGVMEKDPVTRNLRTFRIPIDGTGIVTTPLTPGGLPLANSMPGGGNLGRNTFRGPGFQNWNISLMKTFAIGEEIRFQLRTDFINAWNHDNFQNPEARMSSTAFGANTAAPLTDNRSMLFSGKLRF